MASKRPTRPKKPAGKHPALRPKLSDPTGSAKISKQGRNANRSHQATYRTSQRTSQTAARRILTRSQAKIFRLLDLPAELRNLVYHHAATSFAPASNSEVDDEEDDRERGAIDLKDVTFPAELSLSRQIRAEAIPVFFSANTFKLRVRSNYCVFLRHFHGEEHMRFAEAGVAVLSPLLTRAVAAGADDRDEEKGKHSDGDADEHRDEDGNEVQDEHATVDENEVGVARPPLREAMIRFRHVVLEVDCVCCSPGKQIAKLELSLQGTRPVVECKMVYTPKPSDKVTKPNIEKMFVDVRDAVDMIGCRKVFNGFTVDDVEEVAGCARFEEVEVEELEMGRGHAH